MRAKPVGLVASDEQLVVRRDGFKRSSQVSVRKIADGLRRLLKYGTMCSGADIRMTGTYWSRPILLDDLDKELGRRGLKFARYADDFIIFVKSSRSSQRVFESVQRYLKETLKLAVNQQKSFYGPSEGCEYLGFKFVGKRVTIKVQPKKLKTFKHRIKQITSRRRGISMKQRLTELRRYVRGWIGYFGLAQQVDKFLNLDMRIRRRIRMCFWKQWRHPRTKVRKLVKLGVTLDMAVKHAVSRKSYWRMSRTPAMRYAMPSKWLAEQGVLSLGDLWFQLAPLRGTA